LRAVTFLTHVCCTASVHKLLLAIVPEGRQACYSLLTAASCSIPDWPCCLLHLEALTCVPAPCSHFFAVGGFPIQASLLLPAQACMRQQASPAMLFAACTLLQFPRWSGMPGHRSQPGRGCVQGQNQSPTNQALISTNTSLMDTCQASTF